MARESQATYQRSRLERLCRYITRPPIATKRLPVDTRGRVVYQYKQPFRDGSTIGIAQGAGNQALPDDERMNFLHA